MTRFDSQLGFAVRRWCAPLLGLDPHASPTTYWARRAGLGETEVNRRFLAAAGSSDWLVDTGYGAARVVTRPDALAAVGGAALHEIVRLETLAEELLAAGSAPTGTPTASGRPARPRAVAAPSAPRPSSPTAPASTSTRPPVRGGGARPRPRTLAGAPVGARR